jgi:hypothetical protein
MLYSTDQRQIARGLLVVGMLFAGWPASAVQTMRGQQVYFGDMHWHSCLSQDAQGTTPTRQYESMLLDYGLDFSMTSEHAEGANAGIEVCDTYLPPIPNPLPNAFPPLLPHSGEAVASAMKAAADDWNGSHVMPDGSIRKFVTFPGYEWAPDARCWQASPLNPSPNDLNSDDNTPGHINYFFNDTSGWTFRDDVWEPGDGDSDTCAVVSSLGLTYYQGSKDWVDEILGQLIHQRDDPDRSYDLLIQYNHPAASIDKGGSSDHLAKWYDFEHSGSQCSVAAGGEACSENQCEAVRRAYGLTTVEWYAKQESSIGSTELHGDTGFPCTGDIFLDIASPKCRHDTLHWPERYVSSRGLREGYMLAFSGGSDSHNGRRHAPNGFGGGRGAGGGSLTAVYAGDATRPAIWDGLTRRHTYALSRFRETGPVHKGRVDFFTPQPTGNEVALAAAVDPGDVGGIPTPAYHMGEMVEALATGTLRSFTISAAPEQGTTGVVPLELRLYRVGPDTALTRRTDTGYFWLDDEPGDAGKFGELIGIHRNTTASAVLEHTFTNIDVRPGDAIFAVVPFSDYTWVDDFYDLNRQPLDEDGDGQPDPGKLGFAHTDNNTWARTTPIFFHESNERPALTPGCAQVTFNGSGTVGPSAVGAGDAGIAGDDYVLPVAIPGGYDVEWNRWRFTLPGDYDYVDLSFFNQKDEDDTGHVFAIRIDGQLVYSGRAGDGHNYPADTLVELKDIPFKLGKGLHQIEVHMDDQEYANGDNDPDFHCNDYDGPPAYVDAIVFHNRPGGSCTDTTPPVITCPADVTAECSAAGGVPASDAQIAALLAGASATDDFDTSPTISHDAPTFFPTGTTTVTFTAQDDSGNSSTCAASVLVEDTTRPELAAFSVSPTVLRPPNHKLVPISVSTLQASDVCDAAPRIRCSVTSSEWPNGLGDGNTPIDIVFDGQPIATQGTGSRWIETTAGSGKFTLQLRAERSGWGWGRVYLEHCVAVDAANQPSTGRTAAVRVPR